MKKPSPQTHLRRETNEGFSLPIAVLAGFLLLLGSLALASRSSLGLFGSAFQNKNWAARSAAETGMNTIVSELNRPQNRWLNVVRRNNQDDQDPDYQNADSSGDLWKDRSGNLNEQTKILELRQNPCIVTKSPPSSSEIPDYSGLDPSKASSTTYGKWYVNNDGSISATQGTASKSFRLSKIIRQPYGGKIGSNQRDINGDGTIDENDRYLSVWRDRSTNPSGVGAVTIQVEGQSYQNGKVIASVILERTYELTPKCCGVPFGGRHGNVDYAVQSSGSTVCLTQLGLGLLAGADSSNPNTGSITIKGRATDIKDESLVQDVNPIYCLASNQAGCAVRNNDPNISVAIIDTQLPPAYTFCTPPGGLSIYTSNPCATSPLPKGDFSSISPGACDSLQFKRECDDGVIYDFSAPNLPSYCSRSTDGSVHCNIGKDLADPQSTGKIPDASKKKNIYFITGSSKARLYFPDSGEVFDSSGNTTISNCAKVEAGICTPSKKITDLSLFGSNQRTDPPQEITFAGTIDATNLFIYFPTATVDLRGDSTFSGVLWTNNLESTGNPTWIIPSSGIAEVFELVGLTSGTTGEIEPLFYDFVLRSTNKQRWLGG